MITFLDIQMHHFPVDAQSSKNVDVVLKEIFLWTPLLLVLIEGNHQQKVHFHQGALVQTSETPKAIQ